MVHKGEGDYFDRATKQYPALAPHVERIVSMAGTWDADPRVILAAAQLLADYDDWTVRARDAMRHRRPMKYDSLVAELGELRGQDENTQTT